MNKIKKKNEKKTNETKINENDSKEQILPLYCLGSFQFN